MIDASFKRIMSGKFNSKSIGYALLALLAAGVAGFFIFHFVFRSRTFPNLPIGTYLGTISGLESEHSISTVFMERLASSPTLIAIVFSENSKPQRIALEPVTQPRSPSSTSAFQPLSLRVGERRFSVHGELTEKGVEGFAKESTGREFPFLLQAMQSPLSTIDNDDAPELSPWLRAKATAQILTEQTHALQKELDLDTHRRDRLKELVQQEELLRQRASTRREALSRDLAQAIEEHKQAMQQIESLVSELGVVNRVSEKGRAVEIARRLARRETKWYLANWEGDNGEANMLGEYLADGSPVDIEKLDAAYAHAEEIKRLIQEKETERANIVELRTKLTGRQSNPENRIPTTQPPPPKPNLWNQLFG